MSLPGGKNNPLGNMLKKVDSVPEIWPKFDYDGLLQVFGEVVWLLFFSAPNFCNLMAGKTPPNTLFWMHMSQKVDSVPPNGSTFMYDGLLEV